MSTRASIVVKDEAEKLYFYRHSDGYPEGVLPTIQILMSWVKSGKIRNNVSQFAGWIILLGAIEYNTIPKFETKKSYVYPQGDLKTIETPKDWKCGAFEPATDIADDADYIYTIDLGTAEISYRRSDES